jgi:hypothetical protein
MTDKKLPARSPEALAREKREARLATALRQNLKRRKAAAGVGERPRPGRPGLPDDRR